MKKQFNDAALRALVIVVALIGLGAAILSRAVIAGQVAGRTVIRQVAYQTLPSMNGKSLRLEVVEVNYPPAGFSAPHSHPCPVLAYVVSGEIESQVKGQAEKTYHAGESFFEPPNGVHEISRNASGRSPARLLAAFVCDHPGPNTAPVSSTGGVH